MGIVLFGSILFQRMQHTSGVAPKADFHRLSKTVVLASGSFNMLFAASMMVSGRIEVDMFLLPFEVLFDEEVMVGGSGGRSTHVRAQGDQFRRRV